MALSDPPPFRFASLGPDRRAVAEFESRACFSSTRFDFEFRGGSPPRVRVRRHGWSRETQWHETAILGEIALTDQDLRRLDGLLEVYRPEPEGGCTVTDTVRVMWYERGRLAGREGYIDVSGAVFDSEHVLRLDSLATRLEPTGPRERRRPPGWRPPPTEDERREMKARADAKRRAEATELILGVLDGVPKARTSALELTRRVTAKRGANDTAAERPRSGR
jgi:hypothetical protein